MNCDPLKLIKERVQHVLDGKVILITGGTGSFGQKFIHTVYSKSSPEAIIVYSRDEFKQHQMLTAGDFEKYPNLHFVIGDVRNYDRLYETLRKFGVDIVVHTAAIKHVHFAEKNPGECIATNVTGTINVVRACQNAHVERVLALSTDKCVDPVNLYGASKLCLERVVITGNDFLALQKSHSYGKQMSRDGHRCPIFAVARYGNVLGSRGSVVHVFNEQIKSGEIKITSEDMTRFTLLKEEAVNFALNSLYSMRGGEVFVPILPSYNILQLANVMAPNTPTKITGLRPGEKLAESMISQHESYLAFRVGNHPTENGSSNSGFYVIRHHYFGEYIDYMSYYSTLFGKNIHPVEKQWSYSSDKNYRLTNDRLKELVDYVQTEFV